MLRRINGWVRIPGEEWTTTMDRMNRRIDRATEQWPVKIWSNRIADAKWKYFHRLKSMESNKWPVLACEWKPNLLLDLEMNTNPKRKLGHPLLRWDDSVTNFCRTTFGQSWQDAPTDEWLQFMNGFSRYCNL